MSSGYIVISKGLKQVRIVTLLLVTSYIKSTKENCFALWTGTVFVRCVIYIELNVKSTFTK
jgi:hypothetical protein